MRRRRHHHDGGFHEIFPALVLIRFVILALTLVFMVPITQNKQSNDNRDRGNIRVEMTWEMGTDIDMDLWVQGPNDNPVGFSNQNGQIFNLVRDDIGGTHAKSLHYEVAYGREAPAGEYVVNVAMYANRVQKYPVKVEVVITRMYDSPTGVTNKSIIATKELVFTVEGEEQTVLRFTLNEAGEVVTSKTNTIYKPLFRAPR